MHWKIEMVMDLLTGHGSAPVGGLLTHLTVGKRALIPQQLDRMHINREMYFVAEKCL